MSKAELAVLKQVAKRRHRAEEATACVNAAGFSVGDISVLTEPSCPPVHSYDLVRVGQLS